MFQSRVISGQSLDAGLPQPPRRLTVICVLAAMAMVVTDAAMVNVALPTIAGDLKVKAAMAVRVVTAYQIAILMFLLPSAAAGETFGLRKVFSAGIVTFTAAAILAAWSSSLPWLIAARFAQGMGAAAVMALGIALLRQILPEARIGAGITWNALTVAICSAAGPTIAAVTLTVASWQWLFLLHLPLASVALTSSRALPPARGSGRRLDVGSICLSAAGFCCLFLGLGSLAAAPGAAAISLAGSAATFWALARREKSNSSPTFPVDLLQQRDFRLSVSASICCFVAQTAGMLALPFYLHQTLSPLMIGLYMTPWPVAVACSAVVSGRLLQRYSASLIATVGGALLALGLAAAAVAASGAAPPALSAVTILCGVGFGLFQVANNHSVLLSAPISRSGAAGGLQGTARLTGQTLGAIILALIFASVAPTAAPKVVLAIGACFATAASWISRRRG